MNLRKLVWRELFERKSQMFTCFLAIFLGITAVVAIKNVTHYSEKAVAREMDSLGANVLVLPKSTTLQDYYSADMHDEVIPEEYVMRLTMSDVQGVDNLSPKLCVPVKLQGKEFALTGILPKSEFQAKAAWGGAGIFSRPIGCGTIDTGAEPEDKKTLVRKRVIKDLGSHEILVGPDVAASLGVEEGDPLTLLGEPFSVIAVLPETGTVDDSRIFAHLHTVQRLSGKGPVVNCIEIVGCCKEISAGAGRQCEQAASRREGCHCPASRQDAAECQPHDGTAVGNLLGNHRSRRRSRHSQLHVCQRIRAETRDRDSDGPGGRI